MPDPQKLSVSATQVPALWNASPYVTRWMLWQWFVNGLAMPDEPSARMKWGTKLQPLVLEQAAQELRLEVIPGEERYMRRGNVGCTRDATIICPERGPGALEVKCVFDYKTWMEKWGGGTYIPREIEMQLQVQMMVGGVPACDHCGIADARLNHEDDHDGCDGVMRLTPYSWGAIAVWVAADVYYFQVEPNIEMWSRIELEADRFMGSVRERVEPDPFGVPLELPLFAQAYPTEEGTLLDLRGNEELSAALTVKSRTYISAKAQENAAKKVTDAIRAEFITTLKGRERALLAGGASFGLGRGNRIKVEVPGLLGAQNE